MCHCRPHENEHGHHSKHRPRRSEAILNQYARTGLLSPSRRSCLHVRATRGCLAASCVHIIRPGHVFCQDQVFPAARAARLSLSGALDKTSNCPLVSILRNLPATKASSCCTWSKTMASPSIHTLQCICSTRGFESPSHTAPTHHKTLPVSGSQDSM